MDKLKTKNEVRSIVNEWLNDYTDNSLFDIPIRYDETICIQWPNKK